MVLEHLKRMLLEYFELKSIDFENDDNCFAIIQNNKEVGTLGFKLIDGVPINIYKDKIDYKNTIPVITIKVDNLSLFKDWVIKELVDMGYKYNPVVINSNEYSIDSTDVDLNLER